MAEKTVYIIDLHDKVTGKLKNVDKAATKTDSTFSSMGKSLAGFATVGALLSIGKSLWEITAGAEQTKIKFEVMLGSVEKAGTMIKDIRDFAAKTPFETQDLEQAATTMMQFGIAGEKVMPNLKMLGDVAGGNSEKLKSLTLAFSQIQAAGRLTGQDLLQLVNAGFNPLKTISEKTGISLGKLKDKMSKGLVSADMVEEAFRIETSAGGLFFNMMERQSVTLAGKLSTIVDNIKLMGLAWGESKMGSMHTALDAIAIALNSLEPFKDLFTQIFSPLSQFSAMLEKFSGGNMADGILNTFKTIATVIQVMLLPAQLLTAQLFTIIDAITSLVKLDFKGLADRTAQRFKSPFSTIGDIWKDSPKEASDKANANGLNMLKNSSIGGLMGGIESVAPKLFNAGGAKADPFAGLLNEGEKGKTKKQTAGGIELNESKNGSTIITFNIDTFQENNFGGLSGKNEISSSVEDFLNKMRIGLAQVMNDSQYTAIGN